MRFGLLFFSLFCISLLTAGVTAIFGIRTGCGEAVPTAFTDDSVGWDTCARGDALLAFQILLVGIDTLLPTFFLRCLHLRCWLRKRNFKLPNKLEIDFDFLGAFTTAPIRRMDKNFLHKFMEHSRCQF